MFENNSESNNNKVVVSELSTRSSVFSGTASNNDVSFLEQEKNVTKVKSSIKGIHLRIAQKYNKKRDSPVLIYQHFMLIRRSAPKPKND